MHFRNVHANMWHAHKLSLYQHQKRPPQLR